MDYAPAVLWISQHFVLGRIYPGLAALWISGLGEKWSWRYRSPLPLRRGSGGEDDSCHGEGFFVACGLWDGGGFVTF